MPKAITTDPDIRGVIERDLAVCRNKQSHCDYLTDPWQRWETEIQILSRVLALFTQPPAPSPSSEAAWDEIFDWVRSLFAIHGHAPPEIVPEDSDEVKAIFTRHFGTAILAAAGEKGGET